MTFRIIYGEHGKRDQFFVDGTRVSRRRFYQLQARHAPPQPHHVVRSKKAPGSGWPMKSEALAVHPRQVREANERNAKLGISVTYLADGTAVIPSRVERKKLMQVEGVFDRDAGYGDRAPNPNR